MKKTWIIIGIISVLIICIVLGVIFLIPKSTTNKLESDEASISITYPKDKGYEYNEIQGEMKTGELIKQDGDFLILMSIDKQTMSYWYEGDFNKYKEGRASTFKVSDITINGVTGFSYYDSEKDQYQIVLPINENKTLLINVQPIKRFAGENAQKIFERPEVKKIIETIKIIKK